jgi:hypothetical protein
MNNLSARRAEQAVAADRLRLAALGSPAAEPRRWAAKVTVAFAVCVR